MVVDATDNFESRFSLNAACWRHRTPLVSGAAIRMEGQIAVFDPRDPESPCYRCLYSDDGRAEGEPCALVGVLAPLLGIIGSVQAAETIKLIAGFGTSLAGRLIALDAVEMEWRELRLGKDPACPVCGAETAGTDHVGEVSPGSRHRPTRASSSLRPPARRTPNIRRPVRTRREP